MLAAKSRPAFDLAAIISFLILIAAAGGILFPEVYRDNAATKAGWISTDWVTLVVALPLLAGALIAARRGFRRAYLVLLGTMHYTLYNYVFYLFGAALNWFFLLYVALFMLPVFALIFALTSIDAGSLSRDFRPTTPVRWIGGYMFFWASLLAVAWIAQWARFMATGALGLESEGALRQIAAADLSLFASAIWLGAVWLWKRRPWGYVLATIMNVSGALYTLVLLVGSLVQAAAGAEGAMSLVPLWAFLSLACLAASVALLWNLRPATLEPRTEQVGR